ncbi:MAG: hypothetical protein JXQ75_22675 [Phycisphaerae bacterium]|nr:hypothetical protein [Phycisphaerae bacterium]
MNAEDDHTLEKVAEAEARRRRVFRRMIVIAALCVAALIGVRLWWGYEAGRRLQAEIDQYHAAGQPILVADYAPPPNTPDELNAAVVYGQASAAIVRQTDAAVSFDDAIGDPRVCAAYPDDVRTILEANGETLKLIRQARDLPEADWGIRFTSPLINIMLPSLTPHRELARIASLAAALQHQQGNHAAAIETLLDIHAMAAKLGVEGNATLITHLVTIAVDSLAVARLEEITPTLVVVGTRIDGQPVAHPATREQTQALLRTLLDDQAMRSSWRNGMYAERASELDCVLLVIDGNLTVGFLTGSGPGALGGPGVPRLVRPVFELDAVRMIRHVTQVCEAGLAPDWSKAQEIARTSEPSVPQNLTDKLSHIMSNLLMPSLQRALTLHFRIMAERRMAATALAIRLYELDHRGRPASLDELVPNYLEALPQDPFAAGGRTFGYKPDASPPILYSVGSDGLDDAGEFALRQSGIVDTDQKDIPYFLNGDRPKPPLKLESAD